MSAKGFNGYVTASIYRIQSFLMPCRALSQKETSLIQTNFWECKLRRHFVIVAAAVIFALCMRSVIGFTGRQFKLERSIWIRSDKRTLPLVVVTVTTTSSQRRQLVTSQVCDARGPCSTCFSDKRISGMRVAACDSCGNWAD